MTATHAGLVASCLAVVSGIGAALWLSFGGEVWFSFLAGAFLACF